MDIYNRIQQKSKRNHFLLVFTIAISKKMQPYALSGFADETEKTPAILQMFLFAY